MFSEEGERVASRGVLAGALHERGCLCRQNVGLGERDAVNGWYDDRSRKRRECQVGGTESLAA